MRNRKEIIEEITQNFESIKRRLTTGFHPMAGKIGITPAQGQLLFIVKNHPCCGVTEIAKILGVSKSAATQLTNGLVEKGYLISECDPEDRRALKITISQKSLKKIQRMKAHIMGRLSTIFESLDDEDLDSFLRLTRKVLSNDK